MTWYYWAALGGACWILAAFAVGITFGHMCRRRDEQITDELQRMVDDWQREGRL